MNTIGNGVTIGGGGDNKIVIDIAFDDNSGHFLTSKTTKEIYEIMAANEPYNVLFVYKEGTDNISVTYYLCVSTEYLPSTGYYIVLISLPSLAGFNHYTQKFQAGMTMLIPTNKVDGITSEWLPLYALTNSI